MRKILFFNVVVLFIIYELNIDLFLRVIKIERSIFGFYGILYFLCSLNKVLM